MVNLSVRIVTTGLQSVQVRFTNAVVRNSSGRDLKDCYSAFDVEWLAFLIRIWKVPGSEFQSDIGCFEFCRFPQSPMTNILPN